MLLFPRKLKHKKLHRSSLKKINRIKPYTLYKKETLQIICKTSHTLKSKQLEAVRKLLSRKLKQISKLYIFIFPDLPLTSKPTAMRMGKGKGNFKEWTCKIKAGTSIFKVKGLQKNLLIKTLKTKYNKFPFHTKII